MVSKTGRKWSWLKVGVIVVVWTAGRANRIFGQTDPVTGSEPRLILTIQVCHSAGISGRTLDEAKEEAGRILRQAEVQTIWLDCRPLGIEARTRPDSSEAERQYFSLVILKHALPERPLHGETLGFAVPCPEPDGPCRAYVFYPRVKKLAADSNTSDNYILGHVMAHELGHLLLGPAHAPTGIMRARWDRRDLQRAVWKQLGFAPRQSELIRANVLARNAAQISSR